MKRDPHLVAEEASVLGWPGSVAKYLRQHSQPNCQVLLNISRFLGADEDWQLRFVIRKGRPPKSVKEAPPNVWGIGWETALSLSLDRLCASSGKDYSGSILLDKKVSETTEARELLARLASVLDPNPALPEKCKLVYRRTARGNPTTKLETEISDIEFGLHALKLYAKFKNWPVVENQLRAEGLMKQDNRRRKRAVRLVRSLQK